MTYSRGRRVCGTAPPNDPTNTIRRTASRRATWKMHRPKVRHRRCGSLPINSTRLPPHGNRRCSWASSNSLMSPPSIVTGGRNNRGHFHGAGHAVDVERFRVDFRDRLGVQQLDQVADRARRDLAAIHPAREGQNEVGPVERRQLMNLQDFTVSHGCNPSNALRSQPTSAILPAKASAMLVSSVHAPGAKPWGPPPRKPVTLGKVPGGSNSTAAPSAHRPRRGRPGFHVDGQPTA